ncbi:hypothetical protein SEVIR_3G027301v4 [Setaria viridis]
MWAPWRTCSSLGSCTTPAAVSGGEYLATVAHAFSGRQGPGSQEEPRDGRDAKHMHRGATILLFSGCQVHVSHYHRKIMRPCRSWTLIWTRSLDQESIISNQERGTSRGCSSPAVWSFV